METKPRTFSSTIKQIIRWFTGITFGLMILMMLISMWQMTLFLTFVGIGFWAWVEVLD